MAFKYSSYNGFKNYCCAIARNRGLNVNAEDEQALTEFESVVQRIEHGQSHHIISVSIPVSIYDSIIDLFIQDSRAALQKIKHMNRRLYRVEHRELDFYFFLTGLESILGLKAQFCEEFIYSPDNLQHHPDYPRKIKAFLYGERTLSIPVLPAIDLTFTNKKGVYFIYDSEEKLSYIGKSASCLLTRSFQSVKERYLSDFSRIEYRLTNSVSDVALYEAYYIAKYKPKANQDLVFEDEVTVTLPELAVSYTITRNDSDRIEVTYQYYESKILSMKEFLSNDNVLLQSEKSKRYLEERSYRPASEARQSAYAECNDLAMKNSFYTPQMLETSIFNSRKQQSLEALLAAPQNPADAPSDTFTSD